MRIGTGHNVWYLNPISLDVDDTVKLVLLALHAISGRDSVGSLNGIGKSKWMKLMQNDHYESVSALLGESHGNNRKLYGTNKTSITEARYKKFCKNSMLHLCLLPPMKGELKLHMKRANYQAFGKKQWKENQTYLPQVVTVGCKTWIPRSCVDNGKLQSQSWSW